MRNSQTNLRVNWSDEYVQPAQLSLASRTAAIKLHLTI